MADEWLPVSGYEGRYEVSDRGQVRNAQGLILKLFVHKGYPTVCLAPGHKQKTVHSLVARAFLSEPEPGQCQVRHLNGQRADNRPENLAWGTNQENVQDMLQHGTQNNQVKTSCPADHLLIEPNLVVSIKREGRRACLACSRARARLQKHPDLDFQTTADSYYRRILSLGLSQR